MARLLDNGGTSPQTIGMRGRLATGVVVCVVTALACLPSRAWSETLLAVGSVYNTTSPDGSRLSEPLILRLGAGGWELVQVQAVSGGALLGVAVVGEQHAWAFGQRPDGGLLLRSSDGGATWEDLSSALAYYAPGQVPVAAAFADGSRGWIVARAVGGGGPNVFVTGDAGSTWSFLPDTGPRSVAGTYSLRLVSEDTVQLAVGHPTGTSVRTIEGGRTQVEEGGGKHLLASAFGAKGNEWWAVGREGWTPDGGPDSATIQHANAGMLWAGTKVELGARVDFHAIDFADAIRGLAGGQVIVEDSREPAALILATADGGASWERSTLPSDLGSTRVAALMCVGENVAWGAANRVGDTGVALLYTSDGGLTWSRMPSGVDATGRIRAFGRSR